MIEVNEKLTRSVAHLARLELSDEEVRTFTPQLQDILKYVEQLQAIDVIGVEPLQGVAQTGAPLRADEVRVSMTGPDGKPLVLESAPETESDGFKVPPII